MKKTLVALFALAGLASADVTELTPVWAMDNISLTTAQTIDLSSYNLNTTEGYTLMAIMSNLNGSQAGSIARLTTTGTNFKNSTGTFGFNNNNLKGLTVFNAANGSSTDDKIVKSETLGTATSYQKFAGTFDFGGPYGTVVFMTVQDGHASLYESILGSSTGEVTATVALNASNPMATGNIANLVIGNWAANGAFISSGVADMAIYRGVLTLEQMNSLTPEPATATLSLLALAGLCARRRRH